MEEQKNHVKLARIGENRIRVL